MLQPVLLLREPAYRRAHDGRHDPRPLHLLHRPHVPLPRQQVPPHFSFNSFASNLLYVPVCSCLCPLLHYLPPTVFLLSLTNFLINFLFQNIFSQVLFSAKFRYLFHLAYVFTSFYLFFYFLLLRHFSLSPILSRFSFSLFHNLFSLFVYFFLFPAFFLYIFL